MYNNLYIQEYENRSPHRLYCMEFQDVITACPKLKRRPWSCAVPLM
jgi:hypothetical protein